MDTTTLETPAPVDGYVVLEELPRPDGKLTKEQLDPVVAAARTGDPDAVQALLRLIKPTVVRYCRARIGGRDLSYLSADDVAQEVCLAVLKVLPNYQDRGGSFLYLVRAIAANKVADAFRSIARDRSKPVSELPDRPLGGNEPENRVLEQDLGVRLGRLVALLPPLHREILSLRIIAGLSANEVAEALGISAGNVRITQYRALTKLRGMIGDGEL
ncbi:RNA polymerase sigma factor ShbA [Amycolatopsis sp. NPDC051758]|uniref:RNA polymerase sigma factor ShbA n=1 Tax=Amycolatopsis sp. NPDC051758 TaxID=3363935 RepID=UPI0037B5E4EF